MAHFLDANQLAEACYDLGLETEERALVDACEAAGAAIARKLGVKVAYKASNEPGFGGLCVGFGPMVKGQRCPDEILVFDQSSDWHEETENANATASGGHG